MDAFVFLVHRDVPLDLYSLGARCLSEPPSRRLDGEIYCAVHDVRDCNPLSSDQLLHAGENGEVLVGVSTGLWARLDRGPTLHGKP
jgi:hypothetical protein